MLKKKRKVGRPSKKDLQREKQIKVGLFLAVVFVFTFSLYYTESTIINHVDNLSASASKIINGKKYTCSGTGWHVETLSTGSVICSKDTKKGLYLTNNS